MGTVLPSEKGDRDQAMEEWAPRGESLERVPILVVEDDEDDALLVREMLGPNRFEMAHAQRLAEAKSHLANASPGCVLLDLTLPDAHELEGLIELRTHAPDVPIVILSGLADEQLAVRALQEGAQDYLVKGRGDAELVARSINYAIERKRAEHEQRGQGAQAHRGTVTMLFTDLVGSTELLEQLGDEGAESIRRTHFRLLREAVTARGGREVKNLGDGLMVAFPSAVDAVGCAVKMQQAVDEYNGSHPGTRLKVRVGLNVGEPIQGEDDYFGTPVVVAKRLCDSASGGQILASELVRSLVGTRGRYTFRKSGAFELRGLGEAVPAYEVAWEPPPADRLPLPPVLTAGERTSFVGRRQQLSMLQECWQQSLAGRRQLVFVSGEPGIGKTRLAAEFAISAHKDGATVLYGHSDEETLVPYQPFVEALRHYVVATPVERLRSHVESIPELKRLLPELRQRIPDLPELPHVEPTAERYLLFEGVVALLREIATSAPLLLVLEDLQWADRPTLLLLKHIARSPGQARIMVAATYRETEVFRADPLSETLADLRRDHLFERLPLKGLDEDEVAALVRAWAGEEGRPAFVRAVFAETEGNPFFIEEVLRHLAESGAIYQKGGFWTSDLTIEEMAIPDGVRETIGRRLRRLSEPTYRLLSIASVIGRKFQIDVLERLSDLGGDTLLEALEEAVAAQIIEESLEGTDRYYMFHALFREALHEEVGATRRARLHRSIGEVLEELYANEIDPYLSELAYHFFEARHVGEARKAIDYARRSGDAAMEQLAFEKAAGEYRRALRAMDLDEYAAYEDRCTTLLALGVAQQNAGEGADAEETFQGAADLAREMGDGERLALAALGRAGKGWQAYGVVDGALVALLEEARDALAEEDSPLKARVLGRLSHVLYFCGMPERRQQLSVEAVEMARRSGDRIALGAALDARHWALWEPDKLDERIAVANEMVELAGETHDRELLILGKTWLITDLLELAELDLVDGKVQLHEELAETLRQPYYAWLAKSHRACGALLRGHFSEAERLANEAWSIGQQSSYSDAVQGFGTHMFVLRSEQGRLDELVSDIEDFAREYPTVSGWRAGLCFAYAETGRQSDARVEFERIAADDFREIPVDANFIGALSLLAITSALLGDARRAGQLYLLLAPYAQRLVVFGAGICCFGAVSHWLGLLAATMSDSETAEKHFEQALETYTRIGASSWAAHAKLTYAAVLDQRGQGNDHERARTLSDESIQTAQELGMSALLSRAGRGG
jgi:class 3 adenylate cyclase/tetratricopeptide (TPR) repeat protein